MAISHYAFGAPVHDRSTGEVASPGFTLMVFAFVGGGGVFFAILGGALLRRTRP